MAVDLSKIAYRRKIPLDYLSGKAVAIDAYNMIYQFLSIIRQPDGKPLQDANGNITSNLSGLFYRTIDMMEKGIKPAYVFDGIPSVLKQKTITSRMRRRELAYGEWKKAVEEGDMERARSSAMASTRITKEIVEDSKKLLGLMGVPYIEAPSEGEAQASFMCASGIVYAAASQDYDTLLFGSKRVVRNLSFSGRRKLPMKNVYVQVEPELMELEQTLSSNSITREQLIFVGIMLGTDFNDGIKGIGPKTALKIARQIKSPEELAQYIKEKYSAEFELDIREVFDLFMNPEVKNISAEELESAFRKKVDAPGIVSFMCDERGFDRARIEKQVSRLVKLSGSSKQESINKWF
ncbi:MAG: flap endonuclease-1 [Candidatus Micrarchaeaceae archaeon]